MLKILNCIFLISAFSVTSLAADNRSFTMLDIGPLPGQFDMSDVAFDLGQSCDQKPSFLRSDVDTALKSAPKAFEVLKALGLKPDGNPEIFNGHFMVSKFRSYGTKTKFILVPEAHGYAVPPQFRDQNFTINFKQSLFAIALTEGIQKNKGTVVNLKEGIKGLFVPARDFSPGPNPLEDAGKLYGASLFATLANIFNRGQVYSTNIEDPLPFSIEAFLMLGKFKLGMSFENLMKNMSLEAGEISQDMIPLFRRAYDEITAWDPAKLAQTSAGICEYRSQQMALNAIKLAKEKSPEIIFMTFGMAHSHGIVETLETNGYSYILMNANSRQL